MKKRKARFQKSVVKFLMSYQFSSYSSDPRCTRHHVQLSTLHTLQCQYQAQEVSTTMYFLIVLNRQHIQL